jgi:hypothetical protein
VDSAGKLSPMSASASSKSLAVLDELEDNEDDDGVVYDPLDISIHDSDISSVISPSDEAKLEESLQRMQIRQTTSFSLFPTHDRLQQYIANASELIGQNNYEKKLATLSLEYLCSDREDDLSIKSTKFTTDGSPIYRFGLSKVVTPVDVCVTDPEDAAKGYRVVRENSLINLRVNPKGVACGPEALFGRFRLSVSMTRSLGGRYGPRRCVVNDILFVFVYMNVEFRFIFQVYSITRRSRL